MPLKGVTEFKRNVKVFQRKYPIEIGRAMYREAQIEMTEAKRRTPVWNPERSVPAGHTPGSLRASGQVHEPVVVHNGLAVELTFGNELVDYAVYVHEDLDAHHATGQAKFLESVLNESAPYIIDRIARRIDLSRIVK